MLQRLADQTGHRHDATAKPTSRPWRYLVRLQRDCRHNWKHRSRLANAPFPVFPNCVIGRNRYGRFDIVRTFKVFCVPVAFVEPFGRRSGEVLDRLCDGLRGLLDGSGFH